MKMFNVGDTVILKPNRYSSMGIRLISGHKYKVIGVYHNKTSHYKMHIDHYIEAAPVVVYSSAFNLLESEYSNFKVDDVVTLKSINTRHTEVVYGIDYRIISVFPTKVLVKDPVCGDNIIIHNEYIKFVENSYNDYQIY